jgi:YbbR domain-containing protein
MNWLLRNFWLKVVAFAMALVIWVHVATEKTYNYELKMPITDITLKDGLTLSKAPPDSLLVAVSATGKQLLRRKWRERGLRINASQYQAGRYSVAVNAINTGLAQQTSEVSLDEVISPTVIRLDIDFKDSARVPIQADINAVADEGFAIGHDFQIEPPEAMLIGPRSRLDEVTAVQTRHKRLESLRNTITIRLPLNAPGGYGFNVEPDSVAVTIAVLPVKTRVFDKVPVVVLNTPPGVTLSTDPAFVRVELTGPPEDVDRLEPNAISVSVDFRAQVDGAAPIQVDFPPGYQLRYVSHDTARIIPVSNADPRN